MTTFYALVMGGIVLNQQVKGIGALKNDDSMTTFGRHGDDFTTTWRRFQDDIPTALAHWAEDAPVIVL